MEVGVPFVYFGKSDPRSEQSHVDKFSQMRKNARLYSRWLNMAEEVTA
jgi:hypothetical protein